MSGRRDVALAIALTAIGTLGGGNSFACSCASLTLSEAFARADEVFLARVVDRAESAESADLRFEIIQTPWKTAAGRSGSLVPGQTVSYRTPASSETCGIGGTVGAQSWLVFGRYSEDEPVGRANLCDGTQVWPAEGEGEVLGVPFRHVISQLDAQAALAELRVMGAASPADRLIGLLDLKTLAHGGTVTLREEAAPSSSSRGVIDSYEALETKEVGYEVQAAVVRERRDGWSRVRTADGFDVWIAPEEAGTFFPLAELPIRRLAYWRSGAGSFLWPEPGAGLPRRRPAGAEDDPIEVDDSLWIADSLWFRIRVLERSPCEGGDGAVAAMGWVPAYGPDGEPSVWFYSRGC